MRDHCSSKPFSEGHCEYLISGGVGGLNSGTVVPLRDYENGEGVLIFLKLAPGAGVLANTG